MTRGYSLRFRQAVDLVAACFGLLALLAQAIAPVCLTGGFASPHASSGNSIIICTVHGYRTVALDADGKPTLPKPDNGGDAQCPMCAAAHITPVLVPLAALLLLTLIISGKADRFSVVSATDMAAYLFTLYHPRTAGLLAQHFSKQQALLAKRSYQPG